MRWGRKAPAEPQQPTPSTHASSSAAERVRVVPPNPGSPGTPKQILFDILLTTGGTLVLHGPGSASELLAEATRLTPEVAGSKPYHGVFGEFPWDQETLWALTDGPQGSCLFVMLQPAGDADAITSKVAMPWAVHMEPATSWTHELLVMDAHWPGELAARFQAGDVVPVNRFFADPGHAG